MAFQLKTFTSITASMINYARSTTSKLSDWIPGSGIRTLIEAPAIEIEELYLQVFNGLREAIPTSAYQSFSFDALPPAFAVGYVTISTSPTPTVNKFIPSGTDFISTDGRVYKSVADNNWLLGNPSIRIQVMAVASGSFYNASDGVITSSPLFNSGYTISNSEITTGRDAETDEERLTRFSEYIVSLSKGTVSACVNVIKSAVVMTGDEITEYVLRVGITELPGYLKFYIFSSSGAPSQELIDAASLLLNGYRDEFSNEIVPGCIAGGIRGDVFAMQAAEIPLTVSVTMVGDAVIDSDLISLLLSVYTDSLAAVQPGGYLLVSNLESDMIDVGNILALALDFSGGVIGDGVSRKIFAGSNEFLIPGAFDVIPLGD